MRVVATVMQAESEKDCKNNMTNHVVDRKVQPGNLSSPHLKLKLSSTILFVAGWCMTSVQAMTFSSKQMIYFEDVAAMLGDIHTRIDFVKQHYKKNLDPRRSGISHYESPQGVLDNVREAVAELIKTEREFSSWYVSTGASAHGSMEASASSEALPVAGLDLTSKDSVKYNSLDAETYHSSGGEVTVLQPAETTLTTAGEIEDKKIEEGVPERCLVDQTDELTLKFPIKQSHVKIEEFGTKQIRVYITRQMEPYRLECGDRLAGIYKWYNTTTSEELKVFLSEDRTKDFIEIGIYKRFTNRVHIRCSEKAKIVVNLKYDDSKFFIELCFSNSDPKFNADISSRGVTTTTCFLGKREKVCGLLTKGPFCAGSIRDTRRQNGGKLIQEFLKSF